MKQRLVYWMRVACCAAAPLLAVTGALAEDAQRAMAAPATAVESPAEDCDDQDERCGNMDGDGVLDATSSSSASPDLSSSSLHQDCPDGACVSPPTAEPSGMAINEKGLPGDKGTKPAVKK